VNQRAPGFSRTVYVALALVVLLGAVAVASRGHTAPATGSGHARQPVQILFDVVFTLGVVGGIAMLVGVAFIHAKSQPVQRKTSMRPFLILGVFSVLLATGLVVLPKFHRLTPKADKPVDVSGRLPSASRNAALDRAKEPVFHWSVAAATIALLLAAFTLMIVRERRRRKGTAREWALAMQLANVLDDTLDDLRAEPDPRRAVIAAYARMERALAAHGLPRRESEAPLEYLARVLTDLHASEKAIRGLTDLFAVAKFSDHPIGPANKEQAIRALESLRDDLRAISAHEPPPLKRVPAEAVP
jgi:hypothetical protein